MYIITKLVVHHAYIAVQFYVSRMEDKEIILKYDIDLEDYRIYSALNEEENFSNFHRNINVQNAKS